MSRFFNIAPPTHKHNPTQKTTKACHRGIKKLRFLDDFGVFSFWIVGFTLFRRLP